MPIPKSMPNSIPNSMPMALPLDAIEIRGLRCYGYTGYFDEEQVLGQWFEVTLTLWLDLAPCGADDTLTSSLDYGQVVAAVRSLVEQARFRTVERLNTAILEVALAFPSVLQVRSELVKLAPPLAGFSGQIAVTMTRNREQQADP
jgi:dihydroneopterin aldolase